jgi:hypothetical protein
MKVKADRHSKTNQLSARPYAICGVDKVRAAKKKNKGFVNLLI